MFETRARYVRLGLHAVPVQPETKVDFLSRLGIGGRPPLPEITSDGNGEIFRLRERFGAERGYGGRAQGCPLAARQARVADHLEGGFVYGRVKDVLCTVYPKGAVSHIEVSDSKVGVVNHYLVV